MEIIGAIDIIEGKCVRLSKGDYRKKVIYSDHPLEVARQFEDAGITRLHMVDLDGAAGKPLKNLATLEKIALGTSLVIDFGGGLKRTEDLRAAFDAGASMANLGSVIVNDPELFTKWIIDFGAGKFLPGADVLDGKIRIHGWKDETGIEVFDFISALVSRGIRQLFCTDISKDGMMQGPATDLYREIMDQFTGLYLIASGGVSGYEDLAVLKEAGCSGAIIGKAYYEGKITLEQIAEFNRNV